MAHAHGKDVSVGEYDPVTGLTHITQQRGRLLFNMGASSKRQSRAPAKTPKQAPPTTTGAFTGLSLYPEEAYYLLQRGALVVYLMQSREGDTDPELKQLSVAAFSAMLAADSRVSLACVEVYSFLKEQKLHPRRCLDPLADSSAQSDGRRVPRHCVAGEACDVAYDVWKAVTEPAAAGDVRPDSDEHAKAHQVPTESAPVVAKAKKQRKRLAIVFRVIVCRYEDAAPKPRSIRQAIQRSDGAGQESGPTLGDNVKLAVVHHDKSVLLFEVSTLS